MTEAGQKRHLFGAVWPALQGHIRSLIPAKDTADGFDQPCFLEAFDKFVVGNLRTHNTIRIAPGDAGISSPVAAKDSDSWRSSAPGPWAGSWHGEPAE